MPNLSRIAASVFSVWLSGFIGECVAVGFAEELFTECHPGVAEENFMLVRLWISFAQARFGEAADHLRPLEGARDLLGRRHSALELEIDLPRFRTGVVGTHRRYIIAVGGAGSFGSPALASGI